MTDKERPVPPAGELRHAQGGHCIPIIGEDTSRSVTFQRDCPLTDDAQRWLDRARASISLDTSPWEGDSLQAAINRALLNRVVAAEQQAIEEALTELDGPFVGLLGDLEAIQRQERPE